MNSEKVNFLFEHHPLPMWIFDRQTLAFLAVNEAAICHYGYSREEFLSMTIKAIRPAEDVARLLEDLAQSPPGIDRPSLWRHRKKDGTLIDVQITRHSLDYDGRPAGLVLAMDVTAWKRTENELRSSEERYRVLFENNPNPMWVFDRETFRFLAVNDAAISHYGYAREEFLGMTIQDIRPSEDWPALLELLARKASEFDPNRTWRHRKKNGEIIHVETSSHTLTFAGRKADAVLIHDVTERRRAELALRNSEALYHSLVENLPQNIFRKDLEGRFTFANSRFCELLGRSVEAILGRTDFDFYPSELAAKYQKDDRRIIESGQTFRFEEEHRTPVGKTIHVQVVKSPLHDAQRQVIGVQGIFWDITEQKQLEEELRQAQKMEAIGQLAGGVAHDFNNVLTIIQANAALLQSGDLETEAARINAADSIVQATERAASLTRQLLAFSRRQVMRSRTLDLNELVAHLTTLLQRLIGDDIALENHYGPGELLIRADGGMIEQVLLNLVVNSREAMPRGGAICIRTAAVDLDATDPVTQPSRRAGEFVRLSVSDTGTGIAPEHLPHVFEPFFTTKEVGKGTGLGLATVFGIVEQHSGWIELDSQLGVGTTFHIYLPRACESGAERAEPPAAFPTPGGSETLLVVEDEPHVRILVASILERQGYRVHAAADGPAALKIWEEHGDTIQLVLTDMVMPGGLTGPELVRRLKLAKPDLRAIYTSGYSADAVGKDFPLREGIDYLQKPYQPAKLAQTVRQVLDTLSPNPPR